MARWFRLARRRDFKLRPGTSTKHHRLQQTSQIYSHALCAVETLPQISLSDHQPLIRIHPSFSHIFNSPNRTPDLVLHRPGRSTSRSSTATYNRPARPTPLGTLGRTRRKHRIRCRARTAAIRDTRLRDGAEQQTSRAEACCGVEGAGGPGCRRVDAGCEGGTVARRQRGCGNDGSNDGFVGASYGG
jgi:hypothetical protein